MSQDYKYNSDIIIFERRAIVEKWDRALVEFEAHGAHHTLDQLLTGEYFSDGIPKEAEGRSETEREEFFWPSDKYADTPKTHAHAGR